MKDKELHINFFVECILRRQSIQLHLHEVRNTSWILKYITWLDTRS